MKYRYLKNYDQSLSTIIANIMKFITVYDQVAYAFESIFVCMAHIMIIQLSAAIEKG